jgi:pilus assembly protein CpaE
MPWRWPDTVKVATRCYDYVLVDTPPAFTDHVLAAIDASDLLVLIATLDIPAIKNLRVALDTLDVLGTPKDDRLIVLNRADAKVGLSPDDVARALKRPLTMSIPSSLAVPASTNKGVPIVTEDPKHPVTTALKELADKHVRARFETSDDAAGATRRSRSLWGRR